MQTYRVSMEWIRANTIGRPFFLIGVGMLVYAAVLAHGHDEFTLWAFSIALVFLLPSFLVMVYWLSRREILSGQLQISDRGISVKSVGGVSEIQWTDIQKLYFEPALVISFIRGSAFDPESYLLPLVYASRWKLVIKDGETIELPPVDHLKSVLITIVQRTRLHRTVTTADGFTSYVWEPAEMKPTAADLWFSAGSRFFAYLILFLILATAAVIFVNH